MIRLWTKPQWKLLTATYVLERGGKSPPYQRHSTVAAPLDGLKHKRGDSSSSGKANEMKADICWWRGALFRRAEGRGETAATAKEWRSVQCRAGRGSRPWRSHPPWLSSAQTLQLVALQRILPSAGQIHGNTIFAEYFNPKYQLVRSCLNWPNSA